jgi:Gpi18-like mannosyltransferase
MVPYTESLFCALAFWAWERARADRWLAAALLTSLACTVRCPGLFLIGALLVMIITSDEPARAKLRRGALMLMPAAVIMAFATYLHVPDGSWTAWYRAQSTGWVRQLTWPLDSFLNTGFRQSCLARTRIIRGGQRCFGAR